MKTLFWLAFKFIFKNKERHVSFISMVSCLGIALGVSSLIVVLSVMSGFDTNLREKLLGFNFHLTAYTDLQNNDFSRIKDIEEVQDVVTFSQLHTAVKNEGVIYPVVLEGIKFTEREKKIWDSYLETGDYRKLAVGQILANTLNIHKGDTIQIFNPQTVEPVEFEVSGVFNFGIYDLDSRFVVSSYGYLEDFLKASDSLPSIGIRINDIYRAGYVKDKIVAQGIEGIGLLYTWSELNKSLFSALKLEKITMFIILSLIILVASFNIFTTQTVNVVEKIKDIGILKSLGLSRIKVGFLFCIQGVLLGLTGIILGSALGIGVCLLLEKYHFIKLPAQIYNIDYLPVLVDYKEIILVCIVALVMVILFSLAPGLRAARIEETRALRYE